MSWNESGLHGSRELLHLAPASWEGTLLAINTGLGMVLLPALIPGRWLRRQGKLSCVEMS